MNLAVIMSVYNAGEYVNDAIQSILNQIYDNYLFYILIDGATDNSYEVCNEYRSNEKIKIFTREGNYGLPKSLNFLIRQVLNDNPNIKYIARQDADDISLPDRFVRQIDFLEDNDGFGLIGTWYRIINENGKFKMDVKSPTKDIDIRKDFFNRNKFCHGSIMFRTSLLKEAGMYDEIFERCQDYDLFFRFMTKCKISNIPQILYKWRHSKKYDGLLSKRKYFMMLARYKMYCNYAGIEFNPSNLRKETI